MAFNVGNGKNKGQISEINVTPLVDVMLVLLVIFMITAPLMLNGIKLQLPKTKEVNRVNLTTQQVILSYAKTGDFYIGQDKVLRNEVIDIIKNQFASTKTDTLFLRADYALEYGQVAKLMSFLKNNGILNIALVTEIEEKK
ncbi:transport energizing protein, ExbD/TolR family [Bacteriovorax sp. BSW11_IV]|uniref:biopolymer transporter ExbD n=1 Tax=Bacteriovorax sp. BSW11_IV TaxID=1353529 RepID=UPI000389FEC0|nr:biopolymer transporter ExbD [Bacteriovorax sp. BSW11_IV]EQC49065.1 transport energizing protein, ExbD/TolR family [Bacteriovorax sp. BSW11_IV]